MVHKIISLLHKQNLSYMVYIQNGTFDNEYQTKLVDFFFKYLDFRLSHANIEVCLCKVLFG